MNNNIFIQMQTPPASNVHLHQLLRVANEEEDFILSSGLHVRVRARAVAVALWFR